jgi:integrase
MRQRSPGSWELRVFVGVNPATGRRRYQSRTVRGGRTDAERDLAAMVAAVRAERDIGLASSMSELFEAWFATASLSWAPTTVRQTRSVLDRYLHPHLGDLRVGELTTARIDDLYRDLRRAGGREERPLAPGTLARVHVVLRAALAQAQRWEWIWDKPAERAHRIVTTPPELSPPTPHELRILLEHLTTSDPALHTFVTLGAMTGARRAQLLGLRWRNVIFDTGRVSFTGGWVEGPNGPVLAATKTRRCHAVDLDPGTLAVLRCFRQVCAARTGGVTPVDGFVFSDDAYGAAAWKPNRVTKAFGRARAAAGLRPFRLHDLRHFMATQMLDAGGAAPGGVTPPGPPAGLHHARPVRARGTGPRRARREDTVGRGAPPARRRRHRRPWLTVTPGAGWREPPAPTDQASRKRVLP